MLGRRAAAGLRFMDPSNEKGVFGGANSFFRKPLG